MRIEFFRKLYEEAGCGRLGKEQLQHLPALLDRSQRIRGEIKEITGPRLFGFEVTHVPGHAPDQLAFHHPDRRYLFAGDLVIEHLPNTLFIEPGDDATRTSPVLQQKQSMEVCLDMEPELIYPGHGFRLNPRQF